MRECYGIGCSSKTETRGFLTINQSTTGRYQQSSTEQAWNLLSPEELVVLGAISEHPGTNQTRANRGSSSFPRVACRWTCRIYITWRQTSSGEGQAYTRSQSGTAEFLRLEWRELNHCTKGLSIHQHRQGHDWRVISIQRADTKRVLGRSSTLRQI
jgi:hypothetical protein